MTAKRSMTPSSKCGHSYSKHAILSLFTAKKTSVKCPFAGCGNTVSRSELEVSESVLALAAAFPDTYYHISEPGFPAATRAV